MRNARQLKIAARITGSVLVLWVVLWFVRPFLTDKSLGMSRLLNGWNDSRYAVFHRLFFEIETGTSRAELDALIRRIYPPGGKRTPPVFWVDEPTRIILFMNSEEREGPNCEAIILQISNGTITGKDYSMD